MRIGRRGRAVLLILVGAAAGGAAYVAADVPDSSTGVIHACVQLSDPGNPPNQTPGNFYFIDPSAGQSCPPPANSVLSVDWNFRGAPGAQGPQGPAGNTFTVAAPTVKPTFSPIGHAVLGTGPSAIRFDVLTSGFERTLSSSRKVRLKEISVTKKHDKASAALFQHAASGKHISTGLITVRKAGGTPIEYLTIKLKDLAVSSVQTAASGDEGPTEQISFVYGKLEVEYKPQNP